MLNQTLFDPDAATAAANAAIQQADDNADDTWKANAYSIVRGLAATMDTFTTDDVWRTLDGVGAPAPHEPRALGAVMRRAARTASSRQPTAPSSRTVLPATAETSECGRPHDD